MEPVEPPPPPPPPIVFEMDVHCRRCADVIRGSLVRAFGANIVYASPRMGMVVVHGGEHLDPWTLKCFLQRLGETRPGRHGGGASTRRRSVTVVSDGGRPQRSHFEGIVHMGPPPPYPYPYPPPPPPPPSYAGTRWF